MFLLQLLFRIYLAYSLPLWAVFLGPYPRWPYDFYVLNLICGLKGREAPASLLPGRVFRDGTASFQPSPEALWLQRLFYAVDDLVVRRQELVEYLFDSWVQFVHPLSQKLLLPSIDLYLLKLNWEKALVRRRLLLMSAHIQVLQSWYVLINIHHG